MVHLMRAEARVYHDATQRPASLQMDGVFDSEKDVIDLDKRPGRDTEVGRDESSSNHRSG